MDTSILEDIGLTNAEIKVYLSLLELGSSSAGPILNMTGLQNSVVHMTINRLIEKGFVSYVKEGKRNLYHAANPKHISEYIREKKERFDQIVPDLILRQNLAKIKPEVLMYRGIKGIREMLYELLDSEGKNHNTIGSSSKSLMMGDAWWIQYHKIRAQKGINAKLIFNESLREWCKKNTYPKASYKFTEMGFEPLTETIIRDDKVGIIVWTDKPMGVILQNEEAAKSYNQYFLLLWKNSK